MRPDFSKYADGLVPVIVQDANSDKVLMLGFMNEAALEQTQRDEKVCFFSRSKQRLWTKGETSGHFLQVKEIHTDCDQDTLLIKAIPAGPVCHTGADTCFGEINPAFSLHKLEAVIADRKANPSAGSYTSSLFQKGVNKVAQKVGEEAVELVIESKDNDRDKFLNEAADLLYHYLILLQQKECRLSDVIQILAAREK
jgi:phosphoribosyl-AMP cyclohydrolase / phosphoribosyl-ATP pyrophosphohydrolase